VAADVTKAGSRCQNCDYFAAKAFTKCPACGKAACEDIPDAVEHAIEYALSHGSRVNVVSGPAAELLVSRGGIAALLRYPVPAVDA